jgi:hypothetical protein
LNTRGDVTKCTSFGAKQISFPRRQENFATPPKILPASPDEIRRLNRFMSEEHFLR